MYGFTIGLGLQCCGLGLDTAGLVNIPAIININSKTKHKF